LFRSFPIHGTTSYTYDPLERLTGYTRAGTTTAYGWDKTPNRTSVQVGANPAITPTYDDANRPTSDSAGGSYTSDLDGRLTLRPGSGPKLTWDSLGRLTQVKPSSGNAIATYSYDPLDRLRLVDYGANNRIRFRYGARSAKVTANRRTASARSRRSSSDRMSVCAVRTATLRAAMPSASSASTSSMTMPSSRPG